MGWDSTTTDIIALYVPCAVILHYGGLAEELQRLVECRL